MQHEPAPEWLSVQDVAAELRLTDRQAWELVKRLSIPCVGPVRDCMRLARFRRADWVAARDGSLAPPTPRANQARARVRRSRVTVGAAAGSLKDWWKGQKG